MRSLSSVLATALDTSGQGEMHLAENKVTPSGITAVLALTDTGTDVDSAILNLAAVLDGLVGDQFEILVVECVSDPRLTDLLDGLRARFPGLPLRVLDQQWSDLASALAAGFDAASHQLIFAAPADGDFDVSELNHLLEAIEQGADLALGYQPNNRSVARRLQAWGSDLLIKLFVGTAHADVSCVFNLFRRSVWEHLAVQPCGPTAGFCAELLMRARRSGYRIAEVPVGHRAHLMADARPEVAVSSARRAA